MIFEDTGERRHPRVGEYYRWLRGPHIVLVAREDRIPRDWTDPPRGYAILRMVEDSLAEEVQVWTMTHALAGGNDRFEIVVSDKETDG